MASESKDRGSLQERIARLERENSYLNAQLQMEQKKQTDYKDAVREAQTDVDAADVRLMDKTRELHERTRELMEARSGHEDLMDEGIRRMQDVESYTINSVHHVRSMQRRVAGMMAQRLDMRTVIFAMQRWRSQASTVMGRMELLRIVHQRYANHVLGRPLMRWKKHVDFVMFLSTALPKLALRRRRNLLWLVFRSWRGEASRSARAKIEAVIEDLKAAAQRENGLSAQLREAEEMLAEAYAAQSGVDQSLRDQTQRAEREVQEVRDLLEAALTEERRVHVQLEEAMKEGRAAKAAEQTMRASLAEYLQSHKQEAQALRERLRAAESAFDGLKVKLNKSQATQQDLEDMVTRKEGLTGDKTRTIQRLRSTIEDLEGQSHRLMQQLHSEEGNCKRAEASRLAMQGKLEELERKGSVVVRGRQAVQSEFDDEIERRAQLEDALAKLITAFKEAKEDHRHKLMQAGEFVRMLAAFFEWRRTTEISAQNTVQDVLEYKRQELEVLHSTTAADIAEHAAVNGGMHEVHKLREAVQRLSTELEESQEREEESQAARSALEEQMGSLKETYLKGVKASVQSIRQCRNRYLPTGSANAAE